MAKATPHKRQNFNVTPEEEAELNHLQEVFGAPSVKDAILRSARLALTLAEVREGRKLYLTDSAGSQTRVLLPDIERDANSPWKFLAPRPESWKRQLFLKGRRLSAANVWLDMLTNEDTPEGAAENWELPLEAVEEIIKYCEANKELIRMEAQEEARVMREHAHLFLTPNSK